jgi:hypothetical protein
MKALFGGLLLAAGLLIAGASGLCSVVVAVSTLGNAAGSGDVIGMLMLILLFGGVPFTIGFGLIFWGRSLLRASRGRGID